MKYNKKGIIGITLAAIMIASIFAILPMPMPMVSAADPSELVVNIVMPSGTSFDACENFYVNAVIANPTDYATASDTEATITITGPAELAPSEKNQSTKTTGNILSHGVTDVWWELHCTGPGPVTITVTATSTSPDFTGSDTVNVDQLKEPEEGETVLIIDIFQYPKEMVEECDVFGVKADIINIGSKTAENVTAIIDLNGPASLVDMPDRWSLGDMAPDDNHEVGWTVHCDGPGVVTITVDATADNLVSGEIDGHSVYVDQKMPATLDVDINLPVEDKICTDCDLNSFKVSATVWNPGDVNATGVTATIGATGSGSVNIETPWTKTVGTGTIPADYGSATVVWNVSCTGVGDVTFTVTANGNDEETNNPITDSDTVTIDQKDYTVTIIEPSDWSTYSTKQQFNVTAHLQNCKEEVLADVTAEIDLPAGTKLADGSNVYIVPKIGDPWTVSATESVLISEICPCCWVNVTWILECTESTSGKDVDITVTAKQVDTELDHDTVSIEQETKAHLAAGIVAFPGTLDIYDPKNDTFVTEAVDAFAVCQKFTVVVPVTNWGEADAEYVNITINVTGDVDAGQTGIHSKLFCSGIPGGESDKAIFNFHCNGTENVQIEIINLTGMDENTKDSVLEDNIYVPPCPTVIKQVPFTVEIVEPDPYDYFDIGEQFTVKANITNGGDKPIGGVNVTIDLVGNAALVFGQPETINLGELKAGDYQKVTWQTQCTGYGDVVISVIGTSTDPKLRVSSDTVTVHQPEANPAVVTVEILSPIYETYIATSEEFAVTASIRNAADCAAATINATVNIYPEDGAHVVSDPAFHSFVIAGGKFEVVTWTLQCDKSGDTEIEVNVSWTDELGTSDYVINRMAKVYQYPAAHLEVNITEPGDGSAIAFGADFTVTATITNTGEADVCEGKATLSVMPEGSALLAEGGYTQYIGTLTGHGVKQSKTVTWKLQCEELGKSTITVTASGNDEFGYVVTKKTTSEAIGGFIDAEIGMHDADIYVDGFFDGEVYGYFDGEIDGEFEGGLNGWFCGEIDGYSYCDYYSDWDYYGYVDGYFKGEIGEAWFMGNVDGDFDGDFEGMFTGNLIGTAGEGIIWHGSADVCFDGLIYESYLHGYFDGKIDGWFEGYFCGEIDGYSYCDYHDGPFAGDVAGILDGYYWEGDVDGCFKGHLGFDGEVPVIFSGYIYGGYVITEWTITEDPGAPIYSGFIEPDSITVKQVTEEDLEEPFDDNITLVTGWNFISVPKKLDDAQDTFGKLLNASILEAAYRYDPATPPYWFPLAISDPVKVLDGYWINYSSADTITLSYLTGAQMVPPSKDLTGKAWNAIGFSSVTAKSASTTLKSVEGSWSTVIGWDETEQQYESAIIYEVNDEALMRPGKGYWDWMTADDTVSALSA